MLRRARLQVAGTMLLSGFLFLGGVPGSLRTATAQGKIADDAQIESEVHKTLDNKRYQNVTVVVQNGGAILSGTVNDYADKEEADKRVHHVKGIKGVDNEIAVSGPQIGDEQLRNQLARKLSTYTVGYGTTAFTALKIGVQNGVVTLAGNVYWPPDRDSALNIVASTPGVKDVIDEIQVAPVSPMDDDLRLRLARAIYGASELQKYAIDPAKPIRINVVNGNVELEGVVDSKMDRDIAGIKANGVPGVFKVVNNLQVAGPESGK